MQKYRDWDILEELPNGWVIDKTAGSPAPNTVFITNGKSVLNGQKRALLKVNPKIDSGAIKEDSKSHSIVDSNEKKEDDKTLIFPAKTVNDLARLKFKEQLLKEIMVDLMICEIEGWNKIEYIEELQKLLNGIDISTKQSKLNEH